LLASPCRNQIVAAHAVLGLETAMTAMTGSTADLRRNSRVIFGVTPRFWPEDPELIARCIVDAVGLIAPWETARSVEKGTRRTAPRALFLKGTFGFEMHLMV
jgi:hypothetical protein